MMSRSSGSSSRWHEDVSGPFGQACEFTDSSLTVALVPRAFHLRKFSARARFALDFLGISLAICFFLPLYLSWCISRDMISHPPNLPSKNCSVSRKHSVRCKNTFGSEIFLKEKNHYYVRYKWNLRILTSSTSSLTCNIPLPEVRIIFSSRGREWLSPLFLLT
jgi:hypothetical protein